MTNTTASPDNRPDLPDHFDAYSTPAVQQPVAHPVDVVWQWRFTGEGDDEWKTPAGGQKVGYANVEYRPLYPSPQQPEASGVRGLLEEVVAYLALTQPNSAQVLITKIDDALRHAQPSVSEGAARTFDPDADSITDLVAAVPMPTEEQKRVGELALDDYYNGNKTEDVQECCAHVYRAMRALDLGCQMCGGTGQSANNLNDPAPCEFCAAADRTEDEGEALAYKFQNVADRTKPPPGWRFEYDKPRRTIIMVADKTAATPSHAAPAGEAVRAVVQQTVALALSDGEYIGRHQGGMKPSDVLALRVKVRTERVNAILAALALPAAGGVEPGDA